MLNKIVTELLWTAYGISCPDAETAHKVFLFLREATLDRHIFLTKVVGINFDTVSVSRWSTGEYIARDANIGDSYPELVNCFKDKIFIDEDSKTVGANLNLGVNNVPDVVFTDYHGHTPHVLYSDPYMCRALKQDVTMKLQLEYSNKFRDMAQNSVYLQGDFFPFITDYTLQDYVRILPIFSSPNTVFIRYYNGMTPEIFKGILVKWNAYINEHRLDKEEALWLQHFGH